MRMACGMARRLAPTLCSSGWMMHAARKGSLALSSSFQEDAEAVGRSMEGLSGSFAKLLTLAPMNRWQATASYQLARFSSMASPHVEKDPSTDEPVSREGKTEPSTMPQSPAAPARKKPPPPNTNDSEAGKSEAKLESDDEVSQEEEDSSGLLEEKEALLEQKERVIADLKDKLLRSLAEADNISNRARREAESIKKYAIQGFAKDLLDVADNLGRAAATVPESIRVGDSSNDTTNILKTLLEGVEMTEKQLTQVFKKHGVEKFDPTDQPFNPNQHLALFEVQDANKAPGTIATVLKSGYMLHDRVIRPAEVGVVKQEPEVGAEQES